MLKPAESLPTDRRAWQGGLLFLTSLLVFFVASIVLYVAYAWWRRGDQESAAPLPPAFLISTLCLLGISLMVHGATRCVRRERRGRTAGLLAASGVMAVVFMGVQLQAMWHMLQAPLAGEGLSRGVVGMVLALAFLHALHVAGGVIALGIVATRAMLGRYDHERHWAIDFAALYWHFLDVVWLCMLAAFWSTTGGFRFDLFT